MDYADFSSVKDGDMLYYKSVRRQLKRLNELRKEIERISISKFYGERYGVDDSKVKDGYMDQVDKEVLNIKRCHSGDYDISYVNVHCVKKVLDLDSQAEGDRNAQAEGDGKSPAVGDGKSQAEGDEKAPVARDGKTEVEGDGKAPPVGDGKAGAEVDGNPQAEGDGKAKVECDNYDEGAEGGSQTSQNEDSGDQSGGEQW